MTVLQIVLLKKVMTFEKIKRYLLTLPAFLYINEETFLERYTTSEWLEYELWLFRNRNFTIQKLKKMYDKIKSFKIKPKISIIMPTYNPEPSEFRQAIESLLWQVYPHWELCIVDDQSENKEFLRLLSKQKDKRIKFYMRDIHAGIVDTSNYAIKMASGDYLAFMDQDDEISPDALFSFVNMLQDGDIDYFYSDRDMISPNGKRYMHFFKPDWSPEYLLSSMYPCHLEIYRKTLISDIGGFRKECEGSQDYDLVLRATEKTDKIYHYPMILYSWRQSLKSVASNHEAKAYAYEAASKAIKDALKRRKLPFRDVVENTSLWRGNFKIVWDSEVLSKRKIYFIALGTSKEEKNRLKDIFVSTPQIPAIECLDADYDTENIDKILKGLSDEGYVFFCDDTVVEIVSSGFVDMLGYLSIDGVDVVGCKFVDLQNKIFNAGLNITSSGKILFAYRGYPINENGYGAIAKVPRNVSAVFPSFWGCRVALLKEKGYFKNSYSYFQASMDFFTEVIKAKRRIVYMPYMCLKIDSNKYGHSEASRLFSEKWIEEGLRDIYYNPNLTEINEDYGIKVQEIKGKLWKNQKF